MKHSTWTWIVDVKGRPGEIFEISVLKSNNAHGKRSYGWFGEDKVYIAGSGGPCHDKVLPITWPYLLEAAEATARFLNIRDNRVSG